MSKIVEAVGSTALGPKLGPAIEQAMAQAIAAAEQEAKAIWGRADLKPEEKQAKIAEIMAPESLKERKLAARAKVKEAFRAAAARAAAAMVSETSQAKH